MKPAWFTYDERNALKNSIAFLLSMEKHLIDIYIDKYEENLHAIDNCIQIYLMTRNSCDIGFETEIISFICRRPDLPDDEFVWLREKIHQCVPPFFSYRLRRNNFFDRKMAASAREKIRKFLDKH